MTVVFSGGLYVTILKFDTFSPKNFDTTFFPFLYSNGLTNLTIIMT